MPNHRWPRRGWAILAGAAGLVFVLDQASKAWVMGRLDWGESWYIIPVLRGFFSLTLISNTGAAFGTLKDQGTLLSLLAIVVVAGILVYQRQLTAQQGWLRLSLGLQLGGAAGNLADRLRLGYVVDFLDFYVIDPRGVSHHWPAFNVADSAIVLGVLLLATLLWRDSKSRHSPSPTQGAR
jgi:signal peptidase II